MRWWQCLSMLDMKELPALARHAEDLGFEGITLGEHLVTFQEQYEAYDYSQNGLIRWYPETDWPDPWVEIGALSQITTKLKFLTTVYVLPLRDPFSAAKAIATAANLCEGRLWLGLGVGWQETEFELVGQPFRNRGRRTDEMIELMKALWTGEPVSFEGEFYHLPALQMSPAVEYEVPILIGGNSQRAFERAARHQGLTAAQHEMDEVEAIVGGLRKAREANGASLENFEIALSLYDFDEGNIDRCAEMGVTVLYRDAFCDEKGMASKMTLEEKLRDMDAFASRNLV
ncbi:MAG: TIGR03619 family F420-dependent LLM class oxidoreductase [Deltaproteobacteria bacterium]|nr:TIGR03619 family F420-dependent LLM class oxidoreductase [Deltaproteobacteria bacterium]MBW2496595.1 TIGR03619 family F420-dependent LLM class oxidoreductase [Deltaproteobacteria bacterium]